MYIQFENHTFIAAEFYLLQRVSPKQLCELAHLGCICEAGISYFLIFWKINYLVVSYYSVSYQPTWKSMFAESKSSSLTRVVEFNREAGEIQCIFAPK